MAKYDLSESQKLSFQGEISAHITLSNVFHTLGSKQQQGWLIITNSCEEKSCYFQGKLVGLTSYPSSKIMAIPAKLYYGKKISLEQYQALTATLPNSPGKQILSLFDQVAPQETSEVIDIICYDEICNILACTQGHFEFIRQDTETFKLHEKPIMGKVWEIESLLMESARRQDEMGTIRKSLPGIEEILTCDAQISESEKGSEILANIWDLVDKKGNMQNVVLASYFSEFDALKTIAFLYKNARIRVMTSEEILARAQELEGKNEPVMAREFYEFLEKKAMKTPSLAEPICAFYERIHDNQAAVNLYQQILKGLTSSSEPAQHAQAIKYFKSISELLPESPEDYASRLGIFQLVAEKKINIQSFPYNPLQEGKKLLQHFSKDKDKTAKLLQHLLLLYPENLEFHKQLIQLYLKNQEIPAAITQYENQASVFIKNRDVKNLQLTYQRILRLNPHRQDIVAKLRMTQEKRKKAKKTVLLSTFAILLLSAIGVFIIFTSDSQGEVEKTRAQIQQAKTAEDWERVQEMVQYLPSEQREELNKILSKELAKRDDAAQVLLGEAEQLEKSGDVRQAQNLMQQAVKISCSSSIMQEITNRLQRLKEIVTEFEERLQSAKSWDSKGVLDKAIRGYLELWDEPRFRHFEERNQIRIPLLFKVKPTGGTISVDGVIYKQNLEEVEAIRCLPDFKTIQIALLGYKSCFFYNAFRGLLEGSGDNKEKCQPLSTSSIELLLEKEFWSVPLEASPQGNLCYDNAHLYLVNKDGYFETFTMGEPPVYQSSNKISNVKSLVGAGYIKEVLYIGGNENMIYAVNPLTAHIIGQYTIPTPFLLTPMVISSPEKLICVSRNGDIYSFPLLSTSTRSWAPSWQFSTRQKMLCSPVVLQNQVVAGSKEGILYAIDIKTGNQDWQKRIADPIYSLTSDTQGKIYACTDKYAVCLDVEKRERVWQIPVEGIGYCSFSVSQNTFYCATSQNKIYALSGDDGKVLWEFQASGIFQNAPVISGRDILYAICQEGWIYAIKKGELLWKYRIEKEDKFPSPVIIGNYLVVASRKLYAFHDN